MDHLARQVYVWFFQLCEMGKDNPMKEYQTEYMTFRWSSPENLTEQLNTFVNQGWREHLTKVSGNSDHGWTVLSKTTMVMPDIMEAKLPLRELWRVLNSTAVWIAARTTASDPDRIPVVEEISKQVKVYYEKNAKEMR